MSEKSLSEVFESVDTRTKGSKWRKLLAFIGPAYIISVGYMDPGNWATDLMGGSQFGYKLIWVLLMSNLMALLLQSLSARLGLVKGLDLAQASKITYPGFINIPLYILAEIAIAATDLAEVIGMAIGLQLLFDIPLLIGVLITVIDSFILLYLLQRGIRVMEAFIITLVSIIGLSFLCEMFIVQPEMGALIKGFIPTELNNTALYIAIGIIGATVMPHNLYLHSSLVQTRKIDKSEKGIKTALKYNFIDTAVALNIAFLVNAAILILAAAAFFKNGHTQVAEIQDAHLLLSNIFGSVAPTLFAIALIMAGQSSTITGTLAGQIVMEGYLNLRIRPWLRRLITRFLAIIPALLTIYIMGEESLGELLVLSQVILSLQLGFAVIPLIHFVSDKNMMGIFTIKPVVKVLAWMVAAIIVFLNIKLAIEELKHWIELSGDQSIWIYIGIVPLYVIALALLVYVSLFHFIKKPSLHTSIVPHGKASELHLEALIPPNYHKIAITIDFSNMDRVAINHAIAQGNATTEYTLIHIVESAPARYAESDPNDLESVFDVKNIQAYIQQLKKQGFNANYQLGFGGPVKQIASIVNNSDFNLIVMGAHGHRGLKDIIFGATVDALRHKVSIPVLVVRGE